MEKMDIAKVLKKRRVHLALKRLMDIVISGCALAVLWPVLLLVALAIKIDDPGPVFYRQVRVGKDGKEFRIFKFRTMVVDADRKGLQITVGRDSRITRVGALLRKTKLDELAQLLNVFVGEMSFVGPRPEVPRYVKLYTP
ncbi:MAG: sugar transferase, partial [Eubacteriales bacterium]|nr:sugar transferase [Eubacteriales bacterium]